jgi:hypothetical protein
VNAPVSVASSGAGAATAQHVTHGWFARGVEDGAREAALYDQPQADGYWRCVAYYSCEEASPSQRASYVEGFVCGANPQTKEGEQS